jgi:hypothetical protein
MLKYLIYAVLRRRPQEPPPGYLFGGLTPAAPPLAANLNWQFQDHHEYDAPHAPAAPHITTTSDNLNAAATSPSNAFNGDGDALSPFIFGSGLFGLSDDDNDDDGHGMAHAANGQANDLVPVPTSDSPSQDHATVAAQAPAPTGSTISSRPRRRRVVAAHEVEAASESPDRDGRPLCAVCMERERDTFLPACGHTSTCSACLARLTTQACPVCKKRITGKARMYW